MKYLNVMIFLIMSASSYAQDKLIQKTEETIKKMPSLKSQTPEHISKFTKLKPATKCGKKEVLITIHNISNDEMYFEDTTKKMSMIVEPKTNKTVCVHKKDVIDGHVKHVTIQEERLPIHHLMWYTESLDITVNKDGHFEIKAKTIPHEFSVDPNLSL